MVSSSTTKGKTKPPIFCYIELVGEDFMIITTLLYSYLGQSGLDLSTSLSVIKKESLYDRICLAQYIKALISIQVFYEYCQYFDFSFRSLPSLTLIWPPHPTLTTATHCWPGLWREMTGCPGPGSRTWPTQSPQWSLSQYKWQPLYQLYLYCRQGNHGLTNHWRLYRPSQRLMFNRCL